MRELLDDVGKHSLLPPFQFQLFWNIDDEQAGQSETGLTLEVMAAPEDE
jgi:hypothetical protein